MDIPKQLDSNILECKIKTLDELAAIIHELKTQGKKVVQCHGCFDILHYGHILHFLNSKEQGDILVVTVTPDKFVKKGPGRPFFNEEIRLKHLAALGCVDYVALNKWETAVETIKTLMPNVYSKGIEVLNNSDVDALKNGDLKKSFLNAEIEAIETIGGKIHLTNEESFSSSRIINQITSALPDDSKQFLDEFRKEFKVDDVTSAIDSLKKIKVLVIGDAILDEYIHCCPMDKAGKESIVVHRYSDEKLQLGGVFAVANHVSNFAENVGVLTCIGENAYDFIINHVNKNIEPQIIIQKDSKTLKKTRYIDPYRRNKLFEIYNIEELAPSEQTEEQVIRYLKNNLQKFDMVLISDFGHGFMTPKIISYLESTQKYLAVNCQLNGGNLGYNFITKYNRADFVSLSDREARLPFQAKHGDLMIPIKKINEHLNSNCINVTLGKLGDMLFLNGEIFHAPSFTLDPLDTIGAGDAVLALSSLLAYNKINPKLIPFLGNCMGAIAVRIVGNTRSITSEEIKKFVFYLLK